MCASEPHFLFDLALFSMNATNHQTEMTFDCPHNGAPVNSPLSLEGWDLQGVASLAVLQQDFCSFSKLSAHSEICHTYLSFGVFFFIFFFNSDMLLK